MPETVVLLSVSQAGLRCGGEIRLMWEASTRSHSHVDAGALNMAGSIVERFDEELSLTSVALGNLERWHWLNGTPSRASNG